jgi:hypothetical protein
MFTSKGWRSTHTPHAAQAEALTENSAYQSWKLYDPLKNIDAGIQRDELLSVKEVHSVPILSDGVYKRPSRSAGARAGRGWRC